LFRESIAIAEEVGSATSVLGDDRLVLEDRAGETMLGMWCCVLDAGDAELRTLGEDLWGLWSDTTAFYYGRMDHRLALDTH
jgi:hypothetical protein